MERKFSYRSELLELRIKISELEDRVKSCEEELGINLPIVDLSEGSGFDPSIVKKPPTMEDIIYGNSTD